MATCDTEHVFAETQCDEFQRFLLSTIEGGALLEVLRAHAIPVPYDRRLTGKLSG
ncbi:MAG: hypothetical protein ABI612_19845 [Betaproteobacteria bacterium]